METSLYLCVAKKNVLLIKFVALSDWLWFDLAILGSIVFFATPLRIPIPLLLLESSVVESNHGP